MLNLHNKLSKQCKTGHLNRELAKNHHSKHKLPLSFTESFSSSFSFLATTALYLFKHKVLVVLFSVFLKKAVKPHLALTAPHQTADRHKVNSCIFWVIFLKFEYYHKSCCANWHWCEMKFRFHLAVIGSFHCDCALSSYSGWFPKLSFLEREYSITFVSLTVNGLFLCWMFSKN